MIRGKETSFGLLIFVLALAFISLLQGCSTHKNTWTRRTYHNVTAKYNAYWNGNQAYKQGRQAIIDAHEDNFDQILPVFRLADEPAAQSATPNMNRAIDKAAKVIREHSMEFNGIEYNNWIDNSYLLMGKAHFYKQEYMLAMRFFNFVISKYHRRDLIYDAMTWRAKTSVVMGSYDAAINTLDEVRFFDSRGKVSKDASRLYPRVYAEAYINLGEYDKAIIWLDKSIKAANKRDVRYRMQFIKGQVLMELGDYQSSAQVFSNLSRRNTSYEINFYSRINIALAFRSGMDDYEITEELYEMLGNPNNRDYKDVIYYALAQVSLEENNRNQSLNYLRHSVSSSTMNSRQKAISSLELADMLLEDKEYTLSQAYYDTAMAFLPADYPHYQELQTRHLVLSDLVRNLVQVQHQDSLQRIAQMPPAERTNFINSLIRQIEEEEERARREEQQRMRAITDTRMSDARSRRTGDGSGQWYFYNNQAKSFGFSEFRNRWGDRKLEDNWRYNSVGSDAVFGDAPQLTAEEAETIDTLGQGERLSKKDVEYYLRDLPLTDSAMALSDSIIEEALFNLGLIYQERLQNHEKAIESHEDLLDRFPNSKYRLQAYFYLYRNHNRMGNKTRSDEYRQLILNNYPDSEYANFIRDPDYFTARAQQSDEAEQFYQKMWETYSNNNYQQAISMADTGMVRFRGAEAEPRMALLKAFAKGKMADSTQYAQTLEFIVNNYAQTEPGDRAQQMLQALQSQQRKEKTPEEKETTTQQTEKEQQLYSFRPKQMQLYIAIFEMEGLSMNRIQIAYSDFNREYFGNKNLSVNSVYLDNTRQMLTISRFDNKEDGLRYYRYVNNNQNIQSYFSAGKAKHFIISVDDYSTFYQSKNVEKYLEFFTQNYLNQ